ncbi:SAM-dependent methyltransferase [Elusimicrobiota bacterium]
MAKIIKQKNINVVSLGPGKIEHLTFEAEQVLLNSKKIYCRFFTPLLEHIQQKYNKIVISFQFMYADPRFNHSERYPLYKKIAEFLTNEALNNEGITYALPGSALVGEDTPYLIHKLAEPKGLQVNTIVGISFVDILLNALPSEYKKYIDAQTKVVFGNLNEKIDVYSNNIIAQVREDLLRLYTPEIIIRILSEHYPKNYKFLYIYYENNSSNPSAELKVIESQIKDIKKLISTFESNNGSIFIPSKMKKFDQRYNRILKFIQEDKGQDSTFLFNVLFQEAKTLFNLKKFDEALLIGRKAAGINPKDPHINHLMGSCYLKLHQVDNFWKEIEKYCRKRKLEIRDR